MKISDKRKTELYDAIAKPVIRARIRQARGEIQDTDQQLFDLQNEIWRHVHKALRLEGPR